MIILILDNDSTQGRLQHTLLAANIIMVSSGDNTATSATDADTGNVPNVCNVIENYYCDYIPKVVQLDEEFQSRYEKRHLRLSSLRPLPIKNNYRQIIIPTRARSSC